MGIRFEVERFFIKSEKNIVERLVDLYENNPQVFNID